MKIIRISKNDYDEFNEIANQIINLPDYKKLLEFKQHRKINCYEHSIQVGLRAFIYGKKKKLRYQEMTRAALLHDFFSFDWHDKNKGYHFHGFIHPKLAYNNAKKIFSLSKLEKDIIINHMFPLTLFHIPKSKESWAVCVIDKKCSWSELLLNKTKKVEII